MNTITVAEVNLRHSPLCKECYLLQRNTENRRIRNIIFYWESFAEKGFEINRPFSVKDNSKDEGNFTIYSGLSPKRLCNSTLSPKIFQLHHLSFKLLSFSTASSLDGSSVQPLLP